MKPTLIIAEDVEQIREELHVLLQESFDIVASVPSGPLAIDACRRHEPELLLMDVVMPQMSGFEATKRILEGPPPHPKIVLLSEVTNDKVVRMALESGAAEFLLKSRREERLVKRLLEIAQASLSE